MKHVTIMTDVAVHPVDGSWIAYATLSFVGPQGEEFTHVVSETSHGGSFDIAELQAAVAALEALTEPCEVTLYTSEYTTHVVHMAGIGHKRTPYIEQLRPLLEKHQLTTHQRGRNDAEIDVPVFGRLDDFRDTIVEANQELASRANRAVDLVRKNCVRLGARSIHEIYSTSGRRYDVTEASEDHPAWACSCPDYLDEQAPVHGQGPKCKHILAVMMALKLREEAIGVIQVSAA